MATVVIIGGGTGGMAAARSLRKRLGREHRVVLIEEKPQLTFQPGFLWLMVGRRQEEDISRSTADMKANGAELIHGKALNLDTVGKTIHLENQRTLSYDKLLLAPGVTFPKEENEELAQAGFNLYTAAGALAIHTAIQNFPGGRIVILVPQTPYKCPPAIYETAFLLEEWFRKRSLGQAVDISLHIPEDAPLATFGPQAGKALKRKLRQKGIKLYTKQHLKGVDEGKKTLHFASGRVPYDLLIYVPRHRAPKLVANSTLVDKSGWVPVDPFTLSTREEGVYALGDVTRISLPSGFDMPKTGAVAHLQALVVADNIAQKIKGKKPSRLFGGKGICLVEVGSTAFSLLGDIYQTQPNFWVLPESRIWLAGKVVIERLWLHEHS